MKSLIKTHRYILTALLITITVRTTIYLVSFFNVENISTFLTVWNGWDTSWYLAIAEKGYVTDGKDALAIVFYPGYPLFIKLVNMIIQNLQVSSLITALFFTGTATIFLYKVVLLDYSKAVALKAVWFFNIFPTSYFLQAGYTESAFLTFSLASFYYFRQNKLILSSVGGIFSTLTRINAILLIPSLLTEIFTKKDHNKNRLKQLIALSLFPIGTTIYLSINYITFGDFFYFTKVMESNWFKHISPPWEGVYNLYQSIPPISDFYFPTFLAEIITILFLILLIPFVWMIRKSYAVYIITNLILITSTSFVLSTPRYALTLFPIFIVFAYINNKIFTCIISVISLALLMYFSNFFINQQWAF